MTLNESYEELNRLDKPAFIEELNFFGYNFWPLFRFHLLLKFKSKEEYLAPVQEKKAVPPRHFIGKIKDGFFFRRELKKQFDALKAIGQDKTWFISDKNYYTDKIEGKAYNRHIDPYYFLLTQAGFPCAKLSVGVDPDPAKYYYPLTADFNRFNYFSVYPYDFNGSDFKDLLKKLETTCARENVEINVLQLAKQVYRISKIVPMYEKIFSITRPKTIFLPCFYEPEKFALIMAAKKLGIPVVDLQHGKQGIKHHLYYGWNYVPANGYDMLPDYFWNWGHPSANDIDKNFNQGKQRPVCVAGGNAWLALWHNHKINDDKGPLPLAEKKFDKKILVALQPVATSEFVTFIEELVKQRSNYLVMLRLHPTMQKDKRTFEELAAKYENVELELSSSLLLYSLLRYADAAVTAWSSVIVESRYFNVPGYLMHANGADIFKDDIKEGKIFYTPGAAQFIEHVENIPQVKEDDFIIISEKHIVEQLVKIAAR